MASSDNEIGMSTSLALASRGVPCAFMASFAVKSTGDGKFALHHDGYELLLPSILAAVNHARSAGLSQLIVNVRRTRSDVTEMVPEITTCIRGHVLVLLGSLQCGNETLEISQAVLVPVDAYFVLCMNITCTHPNPVVRFL